MEANRKLQEWSGLGCTCLNPSPKLAPGKREHVGAQNLEVSGGAGWGLFVSRASSGFSLSHFLLNCFFLYIVGRWWLVSPIP